MALPPAFTWRLMSPSLRFHHLSITASVPLSDQSQTISINNERLNLTSVTQWRATDILFNICPSQSHNRRLQSETTAPTSVKPVELPSNPTGLQPLKLIAIEINRTPLARNITSKKKKRKKEEEKSQIQLPNETNSCLNTKETRQEKEGEGEKMRNTTHSGKGTDSSSR